jgi:hypothetical protein
MNLQFTPAALSMALPQHRCECRPLIDKTAVESASSDIEVIKIPLSAVLSAPTLMAASASRNRVPQIRVFSN